MGSESIAHEAEGRMGYWLRGHEQLKQLKLDFNCCFGFQSRRFSLLVGYNK